ncbi:MAG: hypothetical protein KKE62_13890 [Proteobacteria bacterium]|nr:hypothetical protein [Pseudomonadota bacterium]MBU1389911.1 hypothetical protein [Pseudomonadota bacterium]MBU1543920.1 hypothetical protein [Pseudomonadota bacterium]MBU2429651.1 hypothetical protein [Pseudomonadota bacterium]MBU2481975.1 hypothetical protein [Pseudomonadota bacterium]
MKRKLIQMMIVLVMVSGLGGSGYLFYHKLQQDNHIASLEQTLEAEQRKQRMLQKKYMEEKAQVSTCMRAKLAEESKNIAFQKTIAQLQEEKTKFTTQLADLEKKYALKIETCETKILKLEEFKEKLKASREKLIEKYRALALEDRKKSDQISELKGQNQELESNLKMTESTLGRAQKHNARLCEIAEELTQKYRKNAGLQADPFTKIGMVELEHLIQTYIKHIDKEKIITQ